MPHNHPVFAIAEGRLLMQPDQIRRTERAGINALRSLIEQAGGCFQEIDLRNDIGKDAYVDLPRNHRPSGVCVAVQVKSGMSYWKGSELRVKCDRRHVALWRESTVPLVLVVYHPRRNRLVWLNLTSFLRRRSRFQSGVIRVAAPTLLDDAVLAGKSIMKSAILCQRRVTVVPPVIRASTDDSTQAAFVMDYFARGRRRALYLLAIKRSLCNLRPGATEAALQALGLVVGHGDCLYSAGNWVQPEVRAKVLHKFLLTQKEVDHIIRAIAWDQYCRGGSGQDFVAIGSLDASFTKKLETAALWAYADGDLENAFAGSYLATALEAFLPQKGVWDYLLRKMPELVTLPIVAESTMLLNECESLPLF